MGQLFEELARFVPPRSVDVLPIAFFQSADHQVQKLCGLLLEVLFFEVAGSTIGFQAVDPFGEQ
ncbi:hypothetical protein D3C71_2108660 [compost metagenome]